MKVFFSSHPQRLIFLSFLFILFGTFIYGPSFTAPFYLDDFNSIISNSFIQSLPTWAEIGQRFPFRELTYWSFVENLSLHGNEPFGFHVVNFAIHVLTSVAVGWFSYTILSFSKMDGKKASIAAVLTAFVFLIHPLNSQPVVYTVQRATLFAALFYLLALTSYLQLRMTDARSKKIVFCIAIIVCFSLGMVSKQNIVTLPIAILAVEVLLFNSWISRNKYVLFVAIVLGLFALTLIDFVGGFGLLDSIDKRTDISHFSRWEYFTHQIYAFWIYIYKVIVPFPLLLEYEIVPKTWADSQVWFSFLLILLLLAAVIYYRKKHPLYVVLIVLYVIAMSLESSLLVVLDDLMFEHRTYLPNAFLLSFLALLILANMRYRKSVIVSLVVFVAVFSTLTYQRLSLWNNKLNFYRHELTYTFKNPRAYAAVGQIYAEKDKMRRAEKWMRMSLQVSSEVGVIESSTISNFINLLYEQGKVGSANRFAVTALKATNSPRIKAQIMIAMAEMKVRQGQCDFAMGLLNRAIKLAGHNAKTEEVLARCKEID